MPPTELLDPPTSTTNGEKTSTAFIQQLRAQVMEMLERGRPGDRVPPERELARLFNVSHMTIGRVIQDLQQEGIVQRVRGKGTFLTSNNGPLNALPQLGESLADTVSRLPLGDGAPGQILLRTPPLRVAILMENSLGDTDDLTIRRRQWHYRALSQIELQVQRFGGSTVLIDLTEEYGQGLHDRLRLEEPDLILVIPIRSLGSNWAVLRRYQKESGRNIPIACTNLGNSVPPDLDKVSFDSSAGMLLALDHLLDLGHERIAYLYPNTQINYAFLQQRVDVLRDRLSETGQQLELLTVTPDMTGHLLNQIWEVAGRDAAKQYQHHFGKPGAPTAVLVANDMMAGTFLAGLRDLDPELAARLSVVGYDNDLMWSGRYNLTTIHPPIEEIADCALALAQQRLQKPFGGCIHVTLQPRLVVRRSTSPPA